MSKEYEFIKSQKLAGWLEEFADKELKKSSFNNPFDKKEEFDSVEAKVEDLTERVGLNKFIGKTAEDHIPGGLSDNKPDNRYDKDQMEKGMKIEMEHTDNPDIAKEITKDHLEESKDFKDKDGGKYYDELEDTEKRIEEKIGKYRIIMSLIKIANRAEKNRKFKIAKEADNMIRKIAEEINMFNPEPDNNILNKNPEVQKAIDNICEVRGGFIDTPALLDILKKDFSNLKLSQNDEKLLKKYIEDSKGKRKKIRKEPIEYSIIEVEEDNDDIFNTK